MSKETTDTGPSKYVCYKLSKVMRKIQRYYESNLASYEITTGQFFVLSALWENDGMKFKDLAKSLNMDGATLTGILDRMERGGFAERRNDPEDRRSILVYLTEKARMFMPVIISLADGMDLQIRLHISKDDFNIFLKVLEQLSVPTE